MVGVQKPEIHWAVSLFIMMLYFSVSTAQAQYGGGTGEPNDPYLIYTAEQMNAIGANPDDWDKHFKLMADIDLSGFTGTDFNIIGFNTSDDNKPFTGVFDGSGKKIYNFTYTSTDRNYIGLFGYVRGENAVIKDLGLIDPNVDAGTGDSVGLLAGWFGEGTITDCCVVNGSISGNGYVGGLVGNHGAKYETFSFRSTLMSHSYSTAKVSGRHDVGGLAGYIRPYSSITDCHATGNIYGRESSWYLGGLVGSNNYGTIQNCYATGSIYAGKESEKLGGLLGSYTNGSIDNCFASGSVSGGENSKRLGGLVGDIVIGTIANCYATGSVYGGADSQYLGGLVGYQASNGTIDSCYSIGSVHGGEGAEDIGGLVGYFTGGPGYTIYGFTMKCFWDVEASGIQTSNGGMGLTTAQMMHLETYNLNGWAGNPNWIIDDGKDYPRLVWEGTAGQTIPEPDIDWFNGSGIQNDPYIIATADQLALVGKASVLWDKRFVLISDLDLTGIDILRIGICNGMEFTGYFDGNGHVIHNLTVGVRDVSGLALSLFGLIGGSGQVSHLGIENVTILGGENSECLGGLVGENRGMVTHCYATGSVSGRDGSRQLGGLVGFNRKGTVTNCYATVSVSGGDGIRVLGGLVGDNNGTITNCYADSTIRGGTDSRCMGGLAGLNWSRITHCYATGSVTGGYSSRFLGGLVGSNSGSISSSYATGSVSGGPGTVSHGGLVGDYWEDATITNCYFLAPSDGGGPDNRQGLSLTDEQMRQRASFVGWDFVGKTDGPHDIWAEPVEGGYPILSWQLPPGYGLPTFSGGNGEPDDPFLISTATELNSIGHNPRIMGAHFKLINNIDLTGIDFFIIGSELYPFKGVCDGNGYAILNFTHTSIDTDDIGLFGYIDGTDAEIKDLGLIDPNIDAGTGSTVGSLVGYNKGTISNCYVQSARVTGYSGIGGLAGHNDSTITNCYVTGSISGAGSVGGLVGGNGYESITNCYVIGSISGGGWVGGLVGYNFGTNSRCYVTGSVSGDDEVGGLVGHNYDAIKECFAMASVSGTSNIGGLVGNNEGSITECYSNGDTSGDKSVGGLAGCTGKMYFYPVPYVVFDRYSIGSLSGSADDGGLIAYNELYVYWAEIRKCYSTGGVYGTTDVGGLVGFNYESEVISSFWDIETSGLTISAGGTGKTTAEMQTASTFLEASWDFVDETANGSEDIWWILEGQDYPRLWWEAAEK